MESTSYLEYYREVYARVNSTFYIIKISIKGDQCQVPESTEFVRRTVLTENTFEGAVYCS